MKRNAFWHVMLVGRDASEYSDHTGERSNRSDLFREGFRGGEVEMREVH